jgi:branched-chain amino acid transport system substrate-binding protein
MIYSLVSGSAAFAKAAAKIPGFTPILLGTAANAIDLWGLAGEAASLVYWSAVVVDDLAPKPAALNAEVMRRYGHASPALTTTSNAYDIVYLLKAAYELAGTTDVPAVRDAMENLEHVEAQRVYDRPFSKDDHEGVSTRDFSLGRWVDGARTYLNEELVDLEIR